MAMTTWIMNIQALNGNEWKSRADAENEKNIAIDDGFKNAYIVEVDMAI